MQSRTILLAGLVLGAALAPAAAAFQTAASIKTETIEINYAVGTYAEGEFEVFVPWSKFKKHLSPEGLTTFAGDRPRN